MKFINSRKIIPHIGGIIHVRRPRQVITVFKWTKESASAELRSLIDEIPDLMKQRGHCAEHTRWVARTLRALEQVFGQKSRYYLSFAYLKWSESGSFLVGGPGDPEGSWNPQAAIDRRHQEAYVHDLDAAKGFLMAALDDLERSGIDGEYEGKDTGPESSGLVKILALLERKLRKVIRATPTREKAVQDALESLLVGADIPYGRETVSIEYSSKTYIPDFVFQPLDLVVEVKLCSRAEREKEIIAEINDDILAYCTKYGNQVFVVYDVGHIRDVDRFCSAFESQDGVLVRVVKQ